MGRRGREEQAAIEYGVRLAKALVQHARTAGAENGLDAQAVINGASDYLARYTATSRHSPLDPTDVDAERRDN